MSLPNQVSIYSRKLYFASVYFWKFVIPSLIKGCASSFPLAMITCNTHQPLKNKKYPFRDLQFLMTERKAMFIELSPRPQRKENSIFVIVLSCRDFTVLSSSRMIFGYRTLHAKQQLYRKSCFQLDMDKKLNQKQWQGKHKIVLKHEQSQGTIFVISSAPILILLGWPMSSHWISPAASL